MASENSTTPSTARRLGGGVAAVATLALLAPAPAGATVTAGLGEIDSALEVTSDVASDTIAVTCAGGMVKVNGADLKKAPVPCRQISYIRVIGDTGGNQAPGGDDVIDLSGVTPRDFPANTFTSSFGDYFSYDGYLEVPNEGNDKIIGSAFVDGIDDGGGNDLIKVGGGNDQLEIGSGRNRVFGEGGKDEIKTEGTNAARSDPQIFIGGPGKDLIKGGFGSDRLIGGGGNDKLKGFGGRDTLIGGPGNDKLVGGPGKDNCNGRPSGDRLNSC